MAFLHEICPTWGIKVLTYPLLAMASVAMIDPYAPGGAGFAATIMCAIWITYLLFRRERTKEQAAKLKQSP